MASAKAREAQEQLREDITRKKFRPVYLLHGEEDFLVEEAAAALLKAALSEEERGFNLDVLYATETDARDIIARASSFPMMAERRAVVVRSIERLQGRDLELLGAYLEQPSPTTLMILTGKPDLRRKPFSSIKQVGLAVDFPQLYESDIPSWVEARIKKQGREIAPDAAKLLAAYVGTSLREIQSEIDKLFLYLGEKKRITADDVAAVVGISKEFTVFELQKAIGARDMHRATEILGRMLEAGEGAPFIIAMLSTYFTTLWKIADLHRRGASRTELTTQTKVNPYFLKEYLEAVQKYTVKEIRQAFGRLTVADEQVKTGSDSQQVLHLLIVGLLSPGA